jgi:hypothetical protein
LKSNPAILISVTALIMSSASIINALNAKPSFNVRDVAAANRFADWGRRWVFRCDRSAKAAVKKAESFRLGGDFDDYQSAIELALLVTSEISMHLGDGRSIGSDFRYLEARPLFDTETMDAFLAAVSKTKEFADLYRELAPIEVVNHIDRVGLLEDIQSIANVTARLGDHMRRFSNGKWKDQVAH